MKLFSMKNWRRAMSSVVFLFGLTILYLIFLVLAIVPGGSNPQVAGESLAKDPRAGLALFALVVEFLVGLGLVGARVSYFARERIEERRHPQHIVKHVNLRFSKCPICGDNVPFGSLGRGFRGHQKSEHPVYWRWRVRQNLAMTAVLVGWLLGLFPLLILVIVPASRTGDTSRILYGFAAYFGLEAAVLIVSALSIRSGRRRFRSEWQEQHLLQPRTYGNLNGIRARVLVSAGLPVDAATLPLSILHPVSLFIGPVILLVARFSLRRVILDKFVECRLWVYDRFDTLTSFEIEKTLPERSNSERLVLGLKKGSLEIRVDNPSDLETVRSVLSTAMIKAQ